MTIDGNEIRGMRSKRRLSQGTLGRRLGLDVHTIVDIEKGRLGIDEATYVRIKRVLRYREEEGEL